jgi:para-aminobenzoate synthetase component I
MNGLFEQLPTIRDIHRESFKSDQPFERIAAHFARDKGTVVLLSGSHTDSAQYHILAAKPWLQIQSKGKSVQVKTQNKTICSKQEPLGAIQTLLKQFKLPDNISAPYNNTPVAAGLFGYFSYDLKDRIEKLPRTCMESRLPDICLYAPAFILTQEIKTGLTTLQIPVLSSKSIPPDEWIQEIKNFFYNKLKTPLSLQNFSTDSSGFKSSFIRSEYLHAVRKIINYLKAGDIYQANLSQRFETGFQGDAYSLYLELFKRNPAPFFAYIHAGDHHIVSTSPERFIRQNGLTVETRPIKGTIARGKNKAQDQQNKKQLQNSTKDNAELTMIVDLMRNDLSRVSRHDTVIVSEHRRIESYENVYHFVSVIKSELQKDKDSIDLIKATFPGGSITGCPKIRSMEIIDELEPVQRHVYTGSIGYISFHKTMDMSIAIRTAVITKGRIYFSVGGGIVYDSDPEKEYQETLDKGKTLMETLRAESPQKIIHRHWAWVNGKLTEQDKAAICADSPGFQYGAGIFETIRADKGRIFRLEEHLSRMKQSWQSLFSEQAPDITWKNIIKLLLRENLLMEKQAAIKLIIAKQGVKRGAKQKWEADNKPFLAAFARQYQPRLALLKKQGLDLVSYPHPRQSPLADHKSLNYLYYYQAGQYALKNGGDEALILNPDHTVSESNTANILAIDGKTAIIPESEHSLPGVTLKAVLNLLTQRGYDIQKKKIPAKTLTQYPEIILTNALMGTVKVLSIDGVKLNSTKSDKHKIVPNTELCTMINKEIYRKL